MNHNPAKHRAKRHTSKQETNAIARSVEGRPNASTRAFEADPTIENYVKLRHENPREDIGVAAAIGGGLDTVSYMEDDLRRNNIDPDLVLKALQADQFSISELALVVMERIIARGTATTGKGQHRVARKEVISDKLIDWLITCCLHALCKKGELLVPRDLVVLLRERLGGIKTDYMRSARAHQKKEAVPFLAGVLLSYGIEPTYKKLAELLEVDAGTVNRWIKQADVEAKSEWWRRHYDIRDDIPEYKPDDDTSSF